MVSESKVTAMFTRHVLPVVALLALLSSDALAQGRYRPNPYQRRPVYSRPPAYSSYGPATYRPRYTLPPAAYTYPLNSASRPYYTYPPAYFTYRPWYTYAPGFWLYHNPGAYYRGTSLPNEEMPGFQLAW